MKVRTENGVTVITSEEGKVLKRKSDGKIFGEEMWLGYAYYLNNKKLIKPFLEKPEHYEEIDAPEEYLLEHEDLKQAA